MGQAKGRQGPGSVGSLVWPGQHATHLSNFEYLKTIHFFRHSSHMSFLPLCTYNILNSTSIIFHAAGPVLRLAGCLDSRTRSLSKGNLMQDVFSSVCSKFEENLPYMLPSSWGLNGSQDLLLLFGTQDAMEVEAELPLQDALEWDEDPGLSFRATVQGLGVTDSRGSKKGPGWHLGLINQWAAQSTSLALASRVVILKVGSRANCFFF